MTTTSALVDIKNLTFGFHANDLLVKNLNISVPPGAVLFIQGQNGSGKSTLLKILAGQAHCFYDGRISVMPQHKMLYIPQSYDAEIHIPLSLRDVVKIGSHDHGHVLDHELEMTTYGLLEPDDLAKAWQSASGGEKQKTIFVRSFNQKPAIMLFDEPTNHLDQRSCDVFWRVLIEYLSSDLHERCALIVTHTKEIPALGHLKTMCLDLDQWRGVAP